MKALLNNEVIELNELTESQILKVDIAQRTQFNGKWYFNPDMAEIIATVPDKPSPWHILLSGQWLPDESKRAALLETAKDKIDAATDARILTGFQFSGHNFKLTLENQINFQTECSLRDMLTYPHRVKAIDGYFDFDSPEQYRLFYLAGIAFVRQTVEAGWTQKDALNNLSTAELISAINEV